MKKIKARVIAGLIAIAILSILFLLGPAQAFIMDLVVSDNFPIQGDILEFTATAEIESGEILNIEEFVLKITGPQSIECRFLPNGTIIGGCTGIVSIELISFPPLLNGYGPGPGTFEFLVSLDTAFYPVGLYHTFLSAIISGDPVEIEGDEFFISAISPLGCSVRARKGVIDYNETLFEKNKLSFNMPNREAANSFGKGSLTGQEDRIRFRYKFEITGVLRNNQTNMVLAINGDIRERNNRTSESATLFLDKKNKKVTIKDNSFNATGMDVTFIRRC